MTPKRLAVAGICLLIAAASAAYLWFEAQPQVHAERPARGTAVQAVYATGTVEAVQWAKVTPLVTARIVEHCRCEGEAVDKGAVLARLDDQEARAQLAEIEARESFLSEEVRRYRTLQERGVASAQAYERTSSDFSQARAAAAAARERLSQYVLTAPLPGVVLRRDFEVGEVVRPGDVLFWVGQPKPLVIVAEVDEEDIPQVRPGQATLIKSDAFPDRVLTGTVERITPKGDPVTKSYRVRIALPDDTPLLIGMTTEINIVVQQVQDALLVPVGAVAGETVWVLENGRAERKPAKIGIRGGEKVQILSGLSESDTVIADPPADLSVGARVRLAP